MLRPIYKLGFKEFSLLFSASLEFSPEFGHLFLGIFEVNKPRMFIPRLFVGTKEFIKFPSKIEDVN